MKVMMIHWIDDSALPAVGSDEEVAFDRDIDVWDTEMRGRGVLAGGGRLEPVSTATKISMREGEVLVTDGPFAETRTDRRLHRARVRRSGRGDRDLVPASNGQVRRVRAAAVGGLGPLARPAAIGLSQAGKPGLDPVQDEVHAGQYH